MGTATPRTPHFRVSRPPACSRSCASFTPSSHRFPLLPAPAAFSDGVCSEPLRIFRPARHLRVVSWARCRRFPPLLPLYCEERTTPIDCRVVVEPATARRSRSISSIVRKGARERGTTRAGVEKHWRLTNTTLADMSVLVTTASAYGGNTRAAEQRSLPAQAVRIAGFVTTALVNIRIRHAPLLLLVCRPPLSHCPRALPSFTRDRLLFFFPLVLAFPVSFPPSSPSAPPLPQSPHPLSSSRPAWSPSSLASLTAIRPPISILLASFCCLSWSCSRWMISVLGQLSNCRRRRRLCLVLTSSLRFPPTYVSR
ncbi:hypothetical protein C8R45DRAFT_159419 [Mycena sanguinolenta]|nr:hypothetical protein C8R45DRAFT_159419 [Mycena sanguinolenta]